MKLEHYSQKKLEKKILEIVGKYLDLKKYKVFFFGSRVSGENHERSDIDIGIKGPKKIPYGVIYNIQEDMNEKIPTLYKFDVVDFKDADKNFIKVVSQHKEYITKN